MVLGATYMLRFARAILFGASAGTSGDRIADLRPVEAASLLPLLLVIVVLGVAPAAVMSKVQSVAAQIGSPHGK
jgi:NADH:ubiquinone oxidoreductase subunit 4 (subunit M)